MKLIKPSVTQLSPMIYNATDYYRTIETAGRTCYKSEDKMTPESSEKFVKMLIDRGHHAMLEHAPSISMKFICDRGVSHEIVRHRLFSFAQESTRYCNYSGKEMEFILPCWLKSIDETPVIFLNLLNEAEANYNALIKYCDWTPQQARAVLPNALKTEIVVTGNIREWRHFFTLRCAKEAHPQMQEVANIAFDLLYSQIPVLLQDIKDALKI